MGNVVMFAYLPIALFAVTAVVVGLALADAVVRFGNAWIVTRREMSWIDADLTFETRHVGQMKAPHGSARPHPIVPSVVRPAGPQAPLACAA